MRHKKKVIFFLLLLLIFAIFVLVKNDVIENVYYNILEQFYGEPFSEEGLINNSFFGINSDGTNADATTKGINKAIEYASKNNIEYIKLEKGLYIIDGSISSSYVGETSTKKGIILNSNITLDLNGSQLRQIKNSSVNYAIISITDVENVKICNGYIEGDRYEHNYDNIDSTHEWGFGIDIRGSKYVEINNIQIQKTTGDGIMISDYTVNGETCENVEILNCNISDCRRQGISVTCGNNIFIYTNEIHNINGTEPQAGIDVEPYANLQEIRNVNIIENVFYDFGSGRAIAFLGNSYGVIIDNNIIKSGGIISSSFRGIAEIKNNKIEDGQIWIYESQINDITTRNEKIIISSNVINNSNVILVNIPNAVFIDNTVTNKGMRIASSNVAVKGNNFKANLMCDYALEYFFINNEETQKYNLYLFENTYEGKYNINEKIEFNTELLTTYYLEEETDNFINKIIGD